VTKVVADSLIDQPWSESRNDARSVVTSSLLPRSGIGVQAPYLVIAPPGNPTISLDARLLDRIELVGRSSTAPMVTAGVAATIAAAAGLSLIPGGIVLGIAGGYLAVERGMEGRKRAQSKDLLLVLGNLEVALHVADGPVAAKRIAEALAPYARTAPINSADVYEDAKRRLRAEAEGKSNVEGHREASQALAVGDEAVYVRDGFLQVGPSSFRIAEVREHALRGANLPLSGGRLLQAALALLVVAAEDRARAGEDTENLAKRIAQYESWSGHSIGR
jgi:hypothetical protein